MYALSLPHHEVLIHAPATRANGWTHPIPLHHHPKATRRLTRTGMPTAERPAERTHGSQAHPATLKDEAHIGNPSLINPTRPRSLSKITTRCLTLPPAEGGTRTPHAPTPSDRRISRPEKAVHIRQRRFRCRGRRSNWMRVLVCCSSPLVT